MWELRGVTLLLWTVTVVRGNASGVPSSPLYQLESAAFPGFCLDAIGGGPSLDVYSCVDPHAFNAPNELFQLPPSGSGEVAAAAGGCITSNGCDEVTSDATGNALCTAPCPPAPTAATAWSVVNKSGNAVSLVLSAQNQCLAVSPSPTKSVVLADCGATSTLWTVRARVIPPPPPPPPPPLTLTLDGLASGHPFDGHGLLSAGASSRWLIDYPEPYRGQILDYLFTPNFGASLNILKVEIGGDVQSTSGTEPSHMHSRNDLNCRRGYETWLLAEAKRRNPAIKTWGLSWGVPGWVGNGSGYFSMDNIHYQTQWVRCVQEVTGINLDYIGIWNERPYGPMWYTIELRQALDAAGFPETKIVLPDGRIGQDLIDTLNPDSAAYNATFSHAVYALGEHGCGSIIGSTSAFPAQKFFCAESEVSNGWAAAQSWGGTPGRNFISVNQTSTTAWSLIWSVPPVIGRYQNRGAMMANEPWSGHYVVDGTIWMYAHWTQFAELGWTMLGVPSNGSGTAGNAQWVTMVAPNRSDYSVVLDFLHAPSQPLEITFAHLPVMPLAVWQTNETNQFELTATLTPTENGTVFLTAQEGSIYTITTLRSPRKGNYTGVPPSTPCPRTYADNFDNYTTNDTLARFFADQGGSFAVIQQTDGAEAGASSGGGVLAQMAPIKAGPNAWINDPDPVTLIGDATWDDITVAVAARLDAAPTTQPGIGDSTPTPLTMKPCTQTASQRWSLDTPYPEYIENAGVQQCLNQVGCGKDSPLIVYACLPGLSAGCSDNRSNLRWRRVGTQLVLNVTGQCAAATPSGVLTQDCSTPPTPAQTWTFNASSGHLINDGLCLSAPVPTVYVELCGAVSEFNAFGGDQATNGVCLRVTNLDEWQLREGQTVLRNGTTPKPVGSDWHSLRLNLRGKTVVATVDGSIVAGSGQPIAVNGTDGSVTLGSGWHPAFFDNFSVAPLD